MRLRAAAARWCTAANVPSARLTWDHFCRRAGGVEVCLQAARHGGGDGLCGAALARCQLDDGECRVLQASERRWARRETH